MSATIWSSTGRGKEQTGILSYLGRDYTTGDTAKKAGRCDKDFVLFKSFLSHDDPEATMENSPPKGYLQDHTAGSSQRERELLQIYTGRTKIRVCPDPNKNQTMPQAVRTISSPWGVKAMETSVIPMHFSD